MGSLFKQPDRNHILGFTSGDSLRSIDHFSLLFLERCRFPISRETKLSIKRSLRPFLVLYLTEGEGDSLRSKHLCDSLGESAIKDFY